MVDVGHGHAGVSVPQSAWVQAAIISPCTGMRLEVSIFQKRESNAFPTLSQALRAPLTFALLLSPSHFLYPSASF